MNRRTFFARAGAALLAAPLSRAIAPAPAERLPEPHGAGSPALINLASASFLLTAETGVIIECAGRPAYEDYCRRALNAA